jgi:hypothetical protein
MNKKQLISLWCGVIAVVALLFLQQIWYDREYPYTVVKSTDVFLNFFIGVFVISIITAAFICTFRSKKAGDVKKTRGTMRGRTLMRIGLWGAVLLTCLGIFNLVHLWKSVYQWPSDLPGTLGILSSLVLFAIYIFGIVRRNLKIVQRVYHIWLITGVAVLFLTLGVFISGGRLPEGHELFLVVFLCGALTFTFATLILWTGLRGLRRSIEAKSELRVEETSQPERVGDK